MIKIDMEIPTCCQICPCFDTILNTCNIDFELEANDFDSYTKRIDGCPLIECENDKM